MKVLIDSIDTYLPVFTDINNSIIDDTFPKGHKYLKFSQKILLITFKSYLGNRLQRANVNHFSLWSLPVFHKDLRSVP